MSEKNLETDLTFGEILKLYISHWRMFTVFFILFLALASGLFVFKVPYIGASTIIVNDSQNSSMQAFSNQFFGLSKSLQESKKGSSVLSKHLEYLKTRDFFESLIRKIEERGNTLDITLEERQGYELLKSQFISELSNDESRTEFIQALNKWTKFQLDSDFQIKVLSANPNRPVALFLSNTTAQLATEALKAHEIAEIGQVEEFMAKQKVEADQRLSALGKQLADLQFKDNGIFPLASKEKMGDYVSELLVRANEIKLKLAENKKIISDLERGRTGQRESSLYGTGGKVEALKLENSVLSGRLSQVQSSISRLKKEVKALPFASQLVEDLRKKSEVEFSRYKELSSALAKLEAQKLSVDARFLVLEKARWETTLPQIGYLTLGLLSFMLAQVFGTLVVYFRYLWNPQLAVSQEARNLVIYENEPDPHVIFENSRIKLSLKKPPIKNETTAPVAKDPRSWNVLNMGQGTDLPQ